MSDPMTHRLSVLETQKGQRDLLSYRLPKRTLDMLASFLGILLLSPVMVVTALAILLEDGSPVFFVQKRIGKDGRPFHMYKFRSMRKDADRIHERMKREYQCEEISFKLHNDPRVTKTGRIIRKFNVDELPQLFNILAGDMSLVGPRPLPDYEFEEEQACFGDRYEERFRIPQGLTCTWQIADRSDMSFEKRMQMDVDYARNCSLMGDLGLILRTFLYAVTGRAEY